MGGKKSEGKKKHPKSWKKSGGKKIIIKVEKKVVKIKSGLKKTG